jgi:dUTP pyrophosphatase
MTTILGNWDKNKKNTWEDLIRARLEWKPLTETAKGPQKAHGEDAAWDLYADCPNDPIVLLPGDTRIVQTGLAIMPPRGWCCDIRGRSGMNSKGKLVILGLVDSFYTGPWGVVLHNATTERVVINHHDKIAQFTVQRVWESELVQVEEFNIPENSRGSGGFGSSGTK